MCVYRSRRTKPAGSRSSPRSYMKCVSIQKISGDEVDYTIIVLLPAEIMMCGKPDCQTSFKLEHISREIFPAASEKVALDVLWGARCREARERRERERERNRKREREKRLHSPFALHDPIPHTAGYIRVYDPEQGVVDWQTHLFAWQQNEIKGGRLNFEKDGWEAGWQTHVTSVPADGTGGVEKLSPIFPATFEKVALYVLWGARCR